MKIQTKHSEIGYTNNVEIIARALRERFGIEDNSHVATAVAAHIWSSLVTHTPRSRDCQSVADGYEWGTAEIEEAVRQVRHRISQIETATNLIKATAA